MPIPSLASLKDELDTGLAFADFDLSFLLSGEERLTERVKKEKRQVQWDKSLDGNIASQKMNRREKKRLGEHERLSVGWPYKRAVILTGHENCVKWRWRFRW